METSTDSFVLVHQVRRDLDTQKIKAPLQSDELEPIRAIKNHEIHIDVKICRVLRDVKSPRTWGWIWWRWWCAARECLCANEQFSRSKPAPFRSWVLFFLFCFVFFSENKRGIKSRKIHPLANHGFVCHPSVLLYEQTAAIYSSDFPFNPVS